MLTELEPCPFCGGKAYIEREGTRRQSCIIECGSCGARLESGEEGGTCGIAWNRRATSAARGLSGEQIMDAWLRTGHSKDEFLSVHYDFALNVLATAKGDGHV